MCVCTELGYKHYSLPQLKTYLLPLTCCSAPGGSLSHPSPFPGMRWLSFPQIDAVSGRSTCRVLCVLSSFVEVQVLSSQPLGDDSDLLDLTSMAPGHGHGHSPAHRVGESDLEMKLRP